MGCSHSSTNGVPVRKDVRSEAPPSTSTSRTLEDGFGESPRLSATGVGRSSATTAALARRDDVRRSNTKVQVNGDRSPEADHPVNWNLRFSDLIVSEHIANGGYCTVLACVLNGEKRAVKIPLANCSDPDGAITDLINEIKILKRLRHPHLCPVYGAGGWTRKGDLPFLVLERLQDKNLAQQCGTDIDDTSIRMQLRQRKLRAKFPFRHRLKYGLQLVELLNYLHNESIPGGFIVHRDLKPSNLGLSEDGQLKVFDFGLAKMRERRDPFTDRYVMTGQTGSQRFMAPEVFEGMPYNEKADVYSYGVVLWELCTLQKPFAGMSSHQHARKVFGQGLRPPVIKGWPRGLGALMKACWQADPSLRPSAGEAVETLRAILSEMETIEKGKFDAL